MHPLLFGQIAFVTKQKCIVRKRVRGPKFKMRAVFANPANLSEQVFAIADVFQEVRRKNLIDTVVSERKSILRKVDDVIDAWFMLEIQADKSFAFGLTATKINSYWRVCD